MLEILGGKAKALILPGTDDKASHPRSKEVILKKTGILQKCFCAALAALLLLTFFGCSKKPSQNAAITLPEQETSHAGQAGAIFAPSTEFVSADAAGEYRYTKLPIEGYRVRSVFPASGNSVYVIATPCDASGRFHSDAAHSIRSANAAENRFLLPARFEWCAGHRAFLRVARSGRKSLGSGLPFLAGGRRRIAYHRFYGRTPERRRNGSRKGLARWHELERRTRVSDRQ